MEKAYSLKGLADKLKENGLDVAEDAAAEVVKGVFAWLTESAILSSNKVDDFGVALYPLLEKQALAQVDKLDGEDDPER